MRPHLPLTLVGLLSAGCNVFFSPDGYEVAPTTNSSTTSTSGACGGQCDCASSCSRSCAQNCDGTCSTGACDYLLQDGGDVTCAAGTDCFIDCERGSCFVNCEPGASCVLRCGPNSELCDFSACGGTRTTCPGFREACDSDC